MIRVLVGVALLAVFCAAITWLVLVVTRPGIKKAHTHTVGWDGFTEYCTKCGAAARDRRDPRSGMRYTLFRQWEEDDERLLDRNRERRAAQDWMDEFNHPMDHPEKDER